MPSFEQDHYFLLELATIIERSYHSDYTYLSINDLLNQDLWDEVIDGPRPASKEIDCAPENWYTQYWANCAALHICADLDGYEFREICDHEFEDDESLYTGHPLDLY